MTAASHLNGSPSNKPLLYLAADEHVAMVFPAQAGCATLISEFGSNIRAIPFRSTAASSSIERSEAYLLSKGFTRQCVYDAAELDSAFQNAGFTPSQVQNALQLC